MHNVGVTKATIKKSKEVKKHINALEMTIKIFTTTSKPKKKREVLKIHIQVASKTRDNLEACLVQEQNSFPV